MSDKLRFEREVALKVGVQLCEELLPVCEAGRVMLAGSVRRECPDVGDVEILYVSKVGPSMQVDELFAGYRPLADEVIDGWLKKGILARRENRLGVTTWGELIKLGTHVATGLPVDLFATTEQAWWNYLVCRTGSAATNLAIAKAAQSRGWKWAPYSEGFYRAHAPEETHAVKSEREVFEFAGLEWLEPKDR